MLWLIFWVLVILWVLGMVTTGAMGGYLHILLILAVVAICIRLITGRSI